MLAGIAKVLMTTRPTQTSVLESLEECRRLGDEAFLEKYASAQRVDGIGLYKILARKKFKLRL
jgi:hypothetical protein